MTALNTHGGEAAGSLRLVRRPRPRPEPRGSVGGLIGAGLTYDFEGGIFTRLGWDHYTRVGDYRSTGDTSISTYSLGVGMRF